MTDHRPSTTLTERDIAKTIDHSLLRPELDDAFVEDGCRLAAEYDVASVCVPAGRRARGRRRSSTAPTSRSGPSSASRTATTATETKVFEARRALDDGAHRARHGASRSARSSPAATRTSQADIAAVVEVAHAAGAIVKVIFENAYLTDDEKIRACRLTEAAGGDFVKTSHRLRRRRGATHEDLRLMRANTSPHVQVKAAGGVRTLDALLDGDGRSA